MLFLSENLKLKNVFCVISYEPVNPKVFNKMTDDGLTFNNAWIRAKELDAKNPNLVYAVSIRDDETKSYDLVNQEGKIIGIINQDFVSY